MKYEIEPYFAYTEGAGDLSTIIAGKTLNELVIDTYEVNRAILKFADDARLNFYFDSRVDVRGKWDKIIGQSLDDVSFECTTRIRDNIFERETIFFASSGVDMHQPTVSLRWKSGVVRWVYYFAKDEERKLK